MPISAPKIPDGLPELMRGLAKSVIKENPENLYVHAAEYFENLIRERDGELDRGYQGFNAYQVYADYKEQTREKLGLAPTKQPSGSDGEDAGDTGSGDSGSRSRGRRRRRTRNQPSTEKDSSVPVTVKPDTGEVAKQKSLSEDSVEPLSVLEDEVVKVHYNPPEAAPPGRVVSAQSVEAEQAVLTVLEDDQILDSDGKDTAEEDDPVERAEDDDIGTAPSTAEITEEAAPAEPSLANEEIPLQDLETCFMHANVDHLLEKHSEDIAEGVVGDLKKGDTKATEKAPKQEEPHPAPAIDENVTDVPVLESGNSVEKLEDSNIDPALNPSEADEPIGKSSEVKLVGQDVPEGKIGKPQDIGETELDEDQGKEAEKVLEKPSSRSGSAEAPDKSTSGDRSNDEALAKQLEPEILANEVSPETGNEQNVPENAALSVDADANKPEQEAKPIETDGLTKAVNGADTKEPIKLISRMRIDDDEPVGDRVLNDHAIDEVDTGTGDKDANSITDSIVDRENDQVANDSNKDETVPSITNNTEQTVEPTPLDPVSGSEDLKNSLSRNGSKENEVDSKQDPATDKPEPEEAPQKPEDVPVIDDGPVIEEQSTDNEETRGSESVISPKHEPASTPPSGVSHQPSIEVTEKMDTTEPTNTEEPNHVVPIDAKKDERTKNDDTQNFTAADAEPFGDAITDVPVVEEMVAKKSQSLVEGEINKTSVNSDKLDTVQSEATKEETAVEQGALDEQAVPETSPPDGGGNDEVNKLEAAKTDSGEKSSEPNLGQSIEQETNRGEVTETSLTLKDTPIEGPLLDEAATKEDRESPTKPGDELSLTESSTNQSVASRSQLEQLPVENEPQTIQQSAEGNEAKSMPIDGGAVEIAETGAKVVESTLNESLETTNNIELEENGNILGLGSTEDSTPASDKQSSIEKPIETEPQTKGDGTDVKDASEGSTTIETGPGTEEKSKQLDVPEDAKNAVDQPEPGVPEADVAKDPKDEAPQLEAERPGSAKPSPPEQQSLEEVIEEPCIKREVSPSKTLPPVEKEESIDRSKDQELEEIKKVDLSQLSKDSAEALFYSLKKSALENQDPEGSAESGEAPKSRDSNGGDDDDDVVVTEEPPAPIAPEDTAKRTFTDDFLDENPPVEDAPRAEAPSDPPVPIPEATGSAKKPSEGSAENEDDLSPMQTASMRLKQFQDAMHGRADSAEGEGEAASAKRPAMRRCMTEMAELQRYVSADDSADPSYVEEEDQFDGYYIGHIKNKILASSVSVADSDCCDPARGSSGESVDENNVRTALETIASTDTESTIASQATIQQAGKRSYLQKHPQNTSSNIPYASFGNAAIDKSLDEFIEREEQNKQDEAFAEAATKIQRSYRTHKKRLLRDYHSTMRTCTEDASAESGGEEPSNVIQIKLDQKRATDLEQLPSDGGEESPDPGAGSLHVPPRGRPMQSLNIDEYDTVTRRQMLTRGVAMQRNSTPDDDSGKSTNASTDRRSSLSGGGGGGGPVASDSPPEGEEQPSAEPTAVATSGSSEEHDGQKSPGSKPPGNSEPAALKCLARSSSTGQRAPVDVQSLLLMARQRTMPVQIDSSVIRVLPKHMRKRISSADLPNGGKRK